MPENELSNYYRDYKLNYVFGGNCKSFKEELEDYQYRASEKAQ